MNNKKQIALVAHDHRKRDLIEWIEWNWEVLIGHNLICTGTTGILVEKVLHQKLLEQGKTKMLHIKKLKSGPLGGDQQLGALICEGEVDILIFFWDAMQPQPHDVDVKALLRIATVYNIVYACSRATADFVISSSLISEEYMPMPVDFNEYINRKI